MQNKCVLPFIADNYQSNSPCCYLKDFDTEKDIEELLDDHRNNRRSKFCDSCWTLEDMSLESKRQTANMLHQDKLSQTERSISTAVIPVGNVCNLYCVTCSPGGSTSWIKKFSSVYGNKSVDKIQIIKDMKSPDMDIEKLRHIEFIGGETLKSAALWDRLSTLDKKTSYSLQTNGTVELTQDQIDLLSSFENFNICFSLDGYEKIFEYLRQPAKWEKVRNNIKQYIQNFGRDRLSTIVTVSNMNIFYIDDIVLNIFKTLPSKIILNFVYDPEEFSYDNLTKDIGKEVEKNNPVFFKNVKIEWRGSAHSLDLMQKNLEKQDKFSRLKLQDHLPEFFSLLHKKPPTS